VRDLSAQLAAPLSPEDQTVQSMPDASPTKWHLAHTTWFFETFILAEHAPGYARFNDDFTYLFNSYYNGIGEQYSRPDRGKITRPGAEEVRDYRAHVDHAMTELIEHASGNAAGRIADLVTLGLNHEQQHQELLLTDIKHAFSFNPLHPVYRARGAETGKASPLKWIEFEGGIVDIGHDGQGFAFDCEGPRHRILLEPFRLASRPVTNGEFMAFMADGGYENPQFWLSDGWAFMRENARSAPLYWRLEGDAWHHYTLAGLRPVDPDEPVTHVNYYEATAYAAWAGKRLAREGEWEHAAEAVEVAGNMLSLDHLHPRRANGNGGLTQMFGDVWEWTQSAYEAYPGFAAPAGAIGEYNGKFMCDQHVLRGGSCATPEGHIRRSYRNFFPASASWQFSGIRLAEDL